MFSLLRDRDEFVIGAAILGTALAVLNLAYAVEWGWIPSLILLPALPVRAVWKSMPSWLLLGWLSIPAVIAESQAVSKSSYLVLVVGIVIVASERPSRFDQVLIAICVASPFALWFIGTDEWHEGVGAWIWFGGLMIGWVFGLAIGQQWKLIEELERTRTQLADAAVADERQRIARELHDVVGHNFSVVLLHLSGARMILDSDPDAARDALRRAEDVGREGMNDLRQALVLMRDGSESLAPVETGDVQRLVRSYCDAGMQIDIDVTGSLDEADAGPAIVVHDVLREALTNVAKHASTPVATVAIVVDRADDRVDVRVENPVADGEGTGRPGLGLAGLEQRVAAIGGTFMSLRRGDVWIVEARMPRRLAEVSA